MLDQLPLDPPVAPVTTIAWRVVHVGRDVLGKRARAFFAPGEVPDDVVMYDDAYWPEAPPTAADGALAFLTEAYELWRDGVASLDDDALLRTLGSRGGPYSDDTMAALVLHINREVMAHGAEICLLRDLYRAQLDAEDPLVVAALVDDADAVGRLLADGASVRPSLLAEAAGRQQWDIVRALVEHGVDVSAGNPSALHFAAGAGDREAARYLVAHGADLTAVDPQWGMPPSGWAGFFGHADLAAELQ